MFVWVLAATPCVLLVVAAFRARARLASAPQPTSNTAEPVEAAGVAGLNGFLRPYRWPLSLALILTMTSTGLGLLSPWSLKILVDNVIGGDPLPQGLGFLSQLSPSRLALAAAGGGLALVLVNVLLGYLAAFLVGASEQRVAADMREAVFSRMHELALEFHDRNRTGDLVARLSDDVGRVRDSTVAWFDQVAPDALTLVGILVMALVIDPILALAALSVVPVLVYYAAVKRPAMRTAERAARDRQGELATLATESLRNVRLVQAFAQQRFETRRFRQQLDRSADASIRSLDVSARYSPIASVVLALGTAVVSWIGVLQVLAGRLSVGTLIVFLSYLGGIYGPIRNLSRLASTFAKGAASRERLRELFDPAYDVHDCLSPIPMGDDPARIELDEVSFSYEPEHPVLNRLSLDIAPGERVCIVGASGEGKSTLLALLLRLYEPQAGSIRFDGVDLRRLGLAELRRRIALVPQDPWIVDGTVEDNIRFGNPDATRAEFRYAARRSLVDQFATRLPLGFDTPVGEGGALLSGGQLRRIALARAILRDAPILLLDEPTTGLDARSTEEVLAALGSVAAGRTVVIVSHDLKLASRADRIVVLREGRVLESGSHQELLALGGEYSLMWATQTGGVARPHRRPPARPYRPTGLRR